MNNTLFFDGGLYNLRLVEKAVDDYKYLAEILVEPRNMGIICTFEECQYDLRTTMMEFSNYCLDLTVHREEL